MTGLLHGRYAPLTYSIGFLEADFEAALEVMLDWQGQFFPEIGVAPRTLPLQEHLSHLLPLRTPPDRILVTRTRSPWLAYFDNGTRGGDPRSFIGYLSETMKCQGLAVTCVTANTSGGTTRQGSAGPTVSFVLFAAEPCAWLNVRRSVSASCDAGAWSFKATGDPQAFEQLASYANPSIARRFTPEMLDAYCAALGIRLFDERFYGPEGSLLRLGTAAPSDP